MPLGLLTGLGAALSWGTLDIFSRSPVDGSGASRHDRDAGRRRVADLRSWPSPAARRSRPTRVIVGRRPRRARRRRRLPQLFHGAPDRADRGRQRDGRGVRRADGHPRGRDPRREPDRVQAVGAAVATIGVILTGIAFDGGWRATRFASPGVIFAVVALVLFALMSIGTDIVIDRAPWQQVLLVSRSSNAVLSVLILSSR